ncbi:MAG: hypothetical protein JXR94_17405 [Candidatus Hydrogenedentes bacterium]|nr:hypothetical protein [Candidatus Hydrogenedentota bacterium]
MVVLAALLPACRHNNLHSVEERKMTVGLVQKEIRVGMSQAEVIAALGSPNIVSRDNKGKEAYIYDRIATEASYRDSSSSVGGGASVAGGGMPAGNVLLLGTVSGSGSHSRGKGQSATTQKTLTVVIRFDTAGMVESFSYHSSTF